MLETVTKNQRPQRPELVVFGSNYSEILPKQLERLKVQRIFAVVSASLAKNTNELESLRKLLGNQLVGTKLGVGPQRYIQ